MCKMDCKWRKREAKARFLFVEFPLLTHFSCFMCSPQFSKLFLRALNFFIYSPNTLSPIAQNGATHLFKSIGGKFEQSFNKRERNNRENGYKSPTYACVFHS